MKIPLHVDAESRRSITSLRISSVTHREVGKELKDRLRVSRDVSAIGKHQNSGPVTVNSISIQTIAQHEAVRWYVNSDLMENVIQSKFVVNVARGRIKLRFEAEINGQLEVKSRANLWNETRLLLMDKIPRVDNLLFFHILPAYK